jgi:hypothetical protein
MFQLNISKIFYVCLISGDIITVGGTRQKDNYSLEIDEEDRKGIMDRCQNLWPPLKVKQL